MFRRRLADRALVALSPAIFAFNLFFGRYVSPEALEWGA